MVKLVARPKASCWGGGSTNRLTLSRCSQSGSKIDCHSQKCAQVYDGDAEDGGVDGLADEAGGDDGGGEDGELDHRRQVAGVGFVPALGYRDAKGCQESRWAGRSTPRRPGGRSRT